MIKSKMQMKIIFYNFKYYFLGMFFRVFSYKAKYSFFIKTSIFTHFST